jgi:hypothetical protein
MTQTHHLDDETLITIAQGTTGRDDAASHIETCAHCGHELEAWRRIGHLARASVDAVPPFDREFSWGVLGESDSAHRPDSVPRRKGRASVFNGWPRDRRLVIAVPILVTVLVLVLTLGFGSSTPTDAMVLKTIRNGPTVAARLSQTVHWTAFQTDRAPQGFIDVEYSTHGAVDPRTNAFDLTTKTVIPGGASYASSTTLSDGSLVYLPCDVQWTLVGKKPCLAYPAQSGTASGSPSLTFLRHASGPVARLGEREIDGVETTGYRVSVPVSALVLSVIPSERSLVQYADSTISDVRVEVWADQQGLPRELDFTFLVHQATLPGLLHASQKERLSYGSGPLKVSVPGRRRTTIAPSLSAALLLESQYQRAVITYQQEQLGH